MSQSHEEPANEDTGIRVRSVFSFPSLVLCILHTYTLIMGKSIATRLCALRSILIYEIFRFPKGNAGGAHVPVRGRRQ